MGSRRPEWPWPAFLKRGSPTFTRALIYLLALAACVSLTWRQAVRTGELVLEPAGLRPLQERPQPSTGMEVQQATPPQTPAVTLLPLPPPSEPPRPPPTASLPRPHAPPPVLCKAGESFAHPPNGCPLHYKRQSVDDIRAGETPYLFGGPQRPCCRQCLNTTKDGDGHSWPTFCRFESNGPICPAYLREAMIEGYLARGYDGPLTLTPCDFWPYIRQRTTWFLGDSQSLDFYKVDLGWACQLQSAAWHHRRPVSTYAAEEQNRVPTSGSSAPLQAMMCFHYEMWDGNQRGPGTQDADVLKVMSEVLPPMCVELPQGTRICYVRVDTVGAASW